MRHEPHVDPIVLGEALQLAQHTTHMLGLGHVSGATGVKFVVGVDNETADALGRVGGRGGKEGGGGGGMLGMGGASGGRGKRGAGAGVGAGEGKLGESEETRRPENGRTGLLEHPVEAAGAKGFRGRKGGLQEEETRGDEDGAPGPTLP